MDVFLKGLLKLLVLTCAKTPTSGKDIVTRVERLTGGKWKPSPGTIYPLLSSLEENKFLKKHSSGKEIHYLRTSLGSKELELGKKRLLYCSDEMFRTLMPVAFFVLHGFSEEEVASFRLEQEKLIKFRSKLFSLPKEKRFELLKKCFSLLEEQA